MELIFELVAEIILQFIGEVLFQLGFHAVAAPLRDRERAHPVVAGIGGALIGAAFGGLTLLIFPDRILGDRGAPGAGLIVAPVVNGIVMEWYGRRRSRRFESRSHLLTWWGGAIFAFAMVLVRFLALRA